MVIGSIPSGACESGDLLYSNFQFNNPFNSLDSSPGVSVLSILATPTPFGVIFSTNYGIDGGFTNCRFFGHDDNAGSVCIGGDTTIGYDVSVLGGSQQIAAVGLFGGSSAPVTGDGVTTAGFAGNVSEVGCLGAGNAADVPTDGFNFQEQDISTICTNPSRFVVGTLFGVSGALFPPVSNISVAINLTLPTSENGPGLPGAPEIDNVSPFANAFLFVPKPLLVPEPSTPLLLIPGLLALAAFKLKKATA